MMDIRHLRYFVSIVDNDFNLSRASQNLYVSQPALSMMITEFENRENIQIFKRASGKIIGLTFAGENYYRDAKEVIKRYNDMRTNLYKSKDCKKGTITIGIPPLVLSAVFSSVLPHLILKNPDINFIIKEIGAYALKSELLLDKVDLAVLLYPERISKNIIDSIEIHSSELALFLSPKHVLAKKQQITWADLHQQKMAIFDQTFMIHHHLKEAFERNNCYPDIVLDSSYWDFLLSAVKTNKELLTILPLPMAELYYSKEFLCRKIESPVPWKVTLCRQRKTVYTHLEEYIFDKLLEAFRPTK